MAPLVAILESPGRGLPARSDAASALNRLGWQPDTDQLSASYWIARGDWDQLAGIGIPAIEPLIATLRRDATSSCRQAAEALAGLGPQAVALLIAALSDKDVREAAADALGKLGDSRAVEPLIPVLGDKDGSCRKSAARALVDMYHRGVLDDQAKLRVLAMRDTITYPHHDSVDSSDCGNSHYDTGIGVAF